MQVRQNQNELLIAYVNSSQNIVVVINSLSKDIEGCRIKQQGVYDSLI